MELLVAMTILGIVLIAVVIAMQGVQNAWVLTRTSVREQMSGRRALETVTSSLQRATLQTRFVPDNLEDLTPTGPSRAPLAMVPESDLHFVSGPARLLLPSIRATTGHAVFFQGAFGYPGHLGSSLPGTDQPLYQSLPGVLNTWGYYVTFGRDPLDLPGFMTSTRLGRPAPPIKHRFRLMELRQPAHEIPLFFQEPGAQRPAIAYHTAVDPLYSWFREPIRMSLPGGSARDRRANVVAENILALLVVPYEPRLTVLRDGLADTNSPYAIAPDYHFDSRRFQWEPGSTLSLATRHQLPASVEIYVIALGEDSWDNLSTSEAIQQGESLLSLMSGLFLQAANLQNDLARLASALNERRLSHRVMSQVVPLHGTAGRLAAPY